jgi:hydrogenase maturation protein HypF
MALTALETRRYQIRGVVQGVGFRPFVFRTAERFALGGWVRNDSDGVVVEVHGEAGTLEEFIEEVRSGAPALARIESVALIDRRRAVGPVDGFEIHLSERSAQAGTLVSPDSAVCDDCVRELLDPADRRFRYPYINCTNCGPRYSIIRGVPYDRPMTTMAPFPMCDACAREYSDVRDRRFHAQPTACWECGPRVALVYPGEPVPREAPRPGAGTADGTDGTGTGNGAGGTNTADTASGAGAAPDAIAETAALLREGAIVAVKGLGGYHLMVDARDEEAVARLRVRKHREEKPLAVMSPDLDAVREYAEVGEREAELLSGVQRPIVLVRKRFGGGRGLAEGIAPGNRSFGAMLAYTPVHHLLFADGLDALVATSGNVSDEPIAFRDDDALQRLSGIADAFLTGEREIYTRVDDSIVRCLHVGRTRTAGEGAAREHSEPAPMRRARGYTPEPVRAPFETAPLLAVGPELKNTVCLSRGGELFLSHHIGDLKNEATMRSFEHAIEHMSMLLEVTPGLIAHDMHPGYLSTRFALAQDELPTVAVQHHHAHMAACMCENGLNEPVIGVVFDGTGYGTDGNVWGGEFLVGDYVGFERAAHLAYFRLPGGDKAVEEPWRVALALLRQAGHDLDAVEAPVVRNRTAEERRVIGRMIDTGLRSPLTSSMGRLFDGVAALLGVREHCRYEAQAAIELEQLVEPDAAGAPPPVGTSAAGEPLSWELSGPEGWPWRIATGGMVSDLVRELGRGVGAAELSARFHSTVIDIVKKTCEAIRERTGIEKAVLSGGVFQNEILACGCEAALGEAGFEVHKHRVVPANDGGVALGQAAVAGWSGR